MKHLPIPRQLRGLFALFLALPSSLSAQEQDWEKLERCRLETDRYLKSNSFKVTHRGDTHWFFLILCETPETSDGFADRIETHEKVFGVEQEDLLEVADKAVEFTEKALRRSFTVYTKWENAIGPNDRYYAYVITREEKDLAKELMSNGYATTYGEKSDYFDGTPAEKVLLELKTLEQEARKKNVGIWEFSNLPAEELNDGNPPNLVPPEGTVPVTEIERIKEMSDQTALVSGKISNIGQTPSGSITFINFEGSEFTAVVFADDREALETELGSSLKEALEGKIITLQGEISFYKETPQIKITDKAQINPKPKPLETE